MVSEVTSVSASFSPTIHPKKEFSEERQEVMTISVESELRIFVLDGYVQACMCSGLGLTLELMIEAFSSR